MYPLKTYSMSLNNQYEALVHFFTELDIDMINAVLDDNRTYQDYSKPRFIELLRVALDEFLQAGDTQLIPYKGKCNNCVKNKDGLCFLGNKSKKNISIIIEHENGHVLDMYECNDFHAENSTIMLYRRVLIDKNYL